MYSGIQGFSSPIRYKHFSLKVIASSHCLSADPQKRAAYDQHGSDPDSRFSGMSSSGPSAAFARGGGGFEGEISPEELFNMFFGGGMNGGSFGGGFGGPGGEQLWTSTQMNFLTSALI